MKVRVGFICVVEFVVVSTADGTFVALLMTFPSLTNLVMKFENKKFHRGPTPNFV
jgi:hypothetical protein